MLFRVTDDGVDQVPATQGPSADIYESHVEEWVELRPEILGEPLLVIGRQVQMDEGRDRLDLLALDTAGNSVVIEMKRDLIGGDADLQGLRYASMVAAWTYQDFQRQAEGYWRSRSLERGTFAQATEAFCDDGFEINGIQRIILVGREVKPRIGSMVQWLRSNGVEVSIVAIDIIDDGERRYLSPRVVLPIPSEGRFARTVTVASSDRPWLVDGEAWHLEQRASAHGRKTIERLLPVIAEAAPDADGPHWNQKSYVAWRRGSRNWCVVTTGSPNVQYVHFKGCDRTPDEVALMLDWELFHGEAELSQKLELGSSVTLLDNGEMRLIVKTPEDVDHARDALVDVLADSWLHFAGA